MSIYQNIKRIAKQKNIHQKDIAVQFGVSENTITNYFNNRTKIVADHVPLFAKILRVSIQEIYGIDEKEGKSVNEPTGVKSSSCPDCLKKQKEIDRLLKEYDAVKNKYINCLEQLNRVGGERSIANSA